jgi:hypothetical protein
LRIGLIEGFALRHSWCEQLLRFPVLWKTDQNRNGEEAM